MNQTMPLADLFEVKTRFRRSINIAADCADPAVLEDYILTQNGRNILQRLGRGLHPASQNRAWSITGPYGAGKSAFALFLLKLLGYGQGTQARRLLRATDPQLHDELLQQVPGLADGGFVVVPIVGSGEPLPLAVVRGLKQALAASGLRGRGIKGLLASLSEQCEAIANGQPILPGLFTETIERAAKAVRAADERCLGLLLVVDELGKLLEYAALHPGKSDVFDLQSLAEVASRSREDTVGVVVILHQAFEHYAARLTTAQRQEWSKVQNRYEDIGFLEPQSELLRLIGTAIQARPPLDGLADTIADEVGRTSDIDIIPRELGVEEAQQLLRQCAPLHPTVALLLGRLFHSRLAQNERSLFAFLSSGEPCGFREYLRQAWWAGDGHRPFYRLDRLYDYVVGALGSGLYTDRRWAEVAYALDRVPKASPSLAARLIKAIGLLGIAGDQQYLKASEEMLAYALADGQAVTPKQVRGALDRLVQQKIIIYRRYREAYGLWEGSDVDLGECYRRALEQVIDGSASLASLLQSYGNLRPYVAKRHLYETGTLRYFVPWVIDVDDVEAALESPFEPADGAIVFVLGQSGSSSDETLSVVRRAASCLEGSRRYLLFCAVPTDTSGLREALEEVLAWEWVGNNTKELEGDRVARLELAGYQGAAQQRLDVLCRRCFDRNCSFSSARWIWSGEEKHFRRALDLAKALSDACDQAYSCAPIVLNELVNRHALSSAAAAGRHSLIARMFAAPTEARLGIEGHPAELSMYRSVLENSGLHHPAPGGCAFGPDVAQDNCRVMPLWREIDAFLGETERGKRPVSELFARLRRPPFGLRDGLLPIYLAAALLHWDVEVAVYEDGSFIPRPGIAPFERLMKTPDRFSLQRYRLTGGRVQLFDRYASLFEQRELSGAHSTTLVEAVRPLLAFVHGLPPYARSTESISSSAAAVRKVIVTAREPHALLFDALPRALGFEPLDSSSDAATVQAFFSDLRTVLLELQQAYDSLLETVQIHIVQALGLPASVSAARKEAQTRGAGAHEQVADARLRAFLLRVSDSTLTDREWLEQIADIVMSRPPTHWADDDARGFRFEVGRLAARLRRIEEMAFAARGASGDQTDDRLVRLAVTKQGGEEQYGVLRIPPKQEQAVRRIAEALEEALRQHEASPDVSAAAVAELAARMLTERFHGSEEQAK